MSHGGQVTPHNVGFFSDFFFFFNPKGLLFCVNPYNKVLLYEADFAHVLLAHLIKLWNA